ncbi:MAG: hypothetical protein WA840_22940 [Caulobacteraceae bacterium]
MTLSRLAAAALWKRLRLIAERRSPDFVVGREADPYLQRWWVNLSVLLVGTYTEHTIAAGGVNVRTVWRAGQFKLRLPTAAHRVELTHGDCWTLFITGPRMRGWGFHCPNGWVHWKRFTAPDDEGRVGPGCEG